MEACRDHWTYSSQPTQSNLTPHAPRSAWAWCRLAFQHPRAGAHCCQATPAPGSAPLPRPFARAVFAGGPNGSRQCVVRRQPWSMSLQVLLRIRRSRQPPRRRREHSGVGRFPAASASRQRHMRAKWWPQLPSPCPRFGPAQGTHLGRRCQLHTAQIARHGRCTSLITRGRGRAQEPRPAERRPNQSPSSRAHHPVVVVTAMGSRNRPHRQSRVRLRKIRHQRRYRR